VDLKKIYIEAHSGRIWRKVKIVVVHFIFLLPKSVKSMNINNTPKKVLVVDDEPDTWNLLNWCLKVRV